jgi:hypothetical protein
MLARDRAITGNDLLYALLMWKYYAVFLLVRATVRTERQVQICLWITLAVVFVVAQLAILDSLGIFGVSDALQSYYGVESGASRGASTIGSAQAVGDVMVMSLAIAGAMLIRGSRRRILLVGMSVMFVFGIVATGQFSSYIAFVLAFVTVGVLTRKLGRSFLAMLPVVAVALVSLRSVIAARLEDFRADTGLPQSWGARLENLQTYIWPELGKDYNWATGVRPEARVPAPQSWADWIYIESGYTHLLWVGGIPFLIAFAVFLWVAIRRVVKVARERVDSVGTAAIGSATGLVLVAVLTLFDPHLTFRGAADLNFALLALALTRAPERRS